MVSVLRPPRPFRHPARIGDAASEFDPARVFGTHLQYPDTRGRVADWSDLIARAHTAGGMVSLGVDPLALVLLKSPAAMGADIAIGSAQRFGVPLGYGGPHPGFLAARAGLERQMPGRIVGVTHDAAGHAAFRMALQTREQHIRREKATSNICTSQALLANVAALYAIWHGPQGLRRIALRTHFMARLLAAALAPESPAFFDTLTFGGCSGGAIARRRAREPAVSRNRKLTSRWTDDESGRRGPAWTCGKRSPPRRTGATYRRGGAFRRDLERADEHVYPVFHCAHEIAMMRYLKRLRTAIALHG